MTIVPFQAIEVVLLVNHLPTYMNESILRVLGSLADVVKELSLLRSTSDVLVPPI